MPQSAGGRGKDYRESDVQVVFERGPEWEQWSDAVGWLRRWGPRDDRTRSQDVRELLVRDFSQLEQDGVPFTRASGEAFKLAREHRPRHVGVESAEEHKRRRL